MWKWSDLKRLLRKAETKDIADLGAVMWPVVYPDMVEEKYQPVDPHITVVIFNDVNNPDLGYSYMDVIEVVQDTISAVMLWVTVRGVEWFGAEQNVPVLVVEHEMLNQFRDALVINLANKGIPIDMTFPEYKPHVTITADAALDGVYPQRLLTKPVEVWWAKAHYTVPDSSLTVILETGEVDE